MGNQRSLPEIVDGARCKQILYRLRLPEHSGEVGLQAVEVPAEDGTVRSNDVVRWVEGLYGRANQTGQRVTIPPGDLDHHEARRGARLVSLVVRGHNVVVFQVGEDTLAMACEPVTGNEILLAGTQMRGPCNSWLQCLDDRCSSGELERHLLHFYELIEARLPTTPGRSCSEAEITDLVHMTMCVFVVKELLRAVQNAHQVAFRCLHGRLTTIWTDRYQHRNAEQCPDLWGVILAQLDGRHVPEVLGVQPGAVGPRPDPHRMAHYPNHEWVQVFILVVIKIIHCYQSAVRFTEVAFHVLERFQPHLTATLRENFGVALTSMEEEM